MSAWSEAPSPERIYPNPAGFYRVSFSFTFPAAAGGGIGGMSVAILAGQRCQGRNAGGGPAFHDPFYVPQLVGNHRDGRCRRLPVRHGLPRFRFRDDYSGAIT